MEKINIIFDLDESLIFSLDIRRKCPTHTPEYLQQLKTSFKWHDYNKEFIVMERPGLQPFLDWIFANCNVSVWSAASPDYVDYIVQNVILGPFKKRVVKYVFNSTNCDESIKKFGDLKNLQLFTEKNPKFTLSNMILIDDLKDNKNAQKQNCLHVQKFLGTPAYKDDVLFKNLKTMLTGIIADYKKAKRVTIPEHKSPIPCFSSKTKSPSKIPKKIKSLKKVIKSLKKVKSV